MRRFLSPDGVVLCSVPNVQHHSVITALLRSDFQYADEGLLDAGHLRFFTYSTLIKFLLDTGYEPEIIDTTVVGCPKEFLQAAEPLLRYLDLHPGRTQRYLEAYQYVVQGRPMTPIDGLSNLQGVGRIANPSYGSSQSTLDAPVGPASRAGPSRGPDEEVPLGKRDLPMTFVACVSNEDIVRANLLSSPCLRAGSPHEVLLIRGCPSAADGLNEGLRQAKHDVVVCLHQDIYLPEGWDECFWRNTSWPARALARLASWAFMASTGRARS